MKKWSSAIIFYVFILFLLGNKQGFTQPYNPTKISTKAIALYDKAYQFAVANNYATSINILTQALIIDPKYLDALAARADLYARLKNYNASITDFESIVKADTLFAKNYLLNLATSYAGIGNFIKAVQYTDMYLQANTITQKAKDNALLKRKNFDFGNQFFQKSKYKNYVFSPINMGPNINTTDLEYLPSITVDGNTLIFNRRINGDEDFYESKKINNEWQKAMPIAGKLNTNFNEGAQNISQDGEWLIFTGCNYPEGMGSCDLYISIKNKDGQWGLPQNLGRQINTDAWETAPSLSADKQTLYFSSTRLGGFGGSDIWVSKNINGQWQKPQNMGATINTGNDEGCPFLHADNETLYFNSNGHLGYGNNDLFVARKNSIGQWQAPQNLGYPINTIDDEGSLIVAADGKTAYYASDNSNANNKIDLYSFTLREDIQAKKTTWVKGKIFDKKSNLGVAATAQLLVLDSIKYTLSNLQTDVEGNYLTTIPIGKNYAFTVIKKGYLFFTQNFNLNNHVSDSSFVLNIPLQPLEKGASIILNNIFFDINSAQLKPISFAELDNVSAIMQDNPNLIIQINGYTDNVGKPADNVLLSVNRTKAVLSYLTKKGIATKRILVKGFGEKMPIASNNTEDGKALNRRIEMLVISN